ncbi:hypothetical protein [Methylobacterium sp. Leaf466]|uniref:hypothetical protein n=1 Tax=Methylobacterium sp. Leaf466 TaxID=1736386 RepID=UPI000ACA8D70|nr:hypothetical protein [Methylobacterium sp. Leaf466]
MPRAPKKTGNAGSAENPFLLAVSEVLRPGFYNRDVVGVKLTDQNGSQINFTASPKQLDEMWHILNASLAGRHKLISQHGLPGEVRKATRNQFDAIMVDVAILSDKQNAHLTFHSNGFEKQHVSLSLEVLKSFYDAIGRSLKDLEMLDPKKQKLS